ncbi:MAG: DnaD domain protein [Eubacterium sp.]|nr:DnaD domain protein [Eubacterium sp.]
MEFIKSKIKDFYLLDTKIENIFISEYLPAAPGDYVKVFLYGYMYAEHGLSQTMKEMSRQLGISENEIGKAWNYWEKYGVVRKHYLDDESRLDFSVEFVSLKELMYGKAQAQVQEASEKPETNIFGNEEVKKLFDEIEAMLGRNMSSTELTEILSWIEDDNIAPEVVLYGFTYSISKNKASIRYISKVVHGWAEDGLYNVDAVREHLADVDNRFYEYKRVMTALGMHRMPTEAEKRMMDSWFDEKGFNMDKVLEACGQTVGITTPTFKYVNAVLENWAEKAEERGAEVNSRTVSQSTLNQYYSYLQETEKREAEKRREEVYSSLPRIKEIDDEMSRLGATLSKALLMGKEKGNAQKIREHMDRLAEERAVTLTDGGFAMDYTDIRYKCSKCNDTGITDLGERCTCVAERMEEAAAWASTLNRR